MAASGPEKGHRRRCVAQLRYLVESRGLNRISHHKTLATSTLTEYPKTQPHDFTRKHNSKGNVFILSLPRFQDNNNIVVDVALAVEKNIE